MGADRTLAEHRAGAGDTSTETNAKMIRQAANQMTRLIRDLLDFTSIETGRLRIELTEHDPKALVDEAIELMRPAASEKRVRLAIESPSSNATVRCESGRIVQVLTNLIGNALKHTVEGEVIVARIAVERDLVVFSVCDTGPGIRQEHLSRVFDRYWQAEGGARDGLGLGLAMSKAIVESHGGKIWAATNAERGSTFFFSLPIASSP